MIEIIKREEGKISEKERLEGIRPQISFNSDCHLVIRILQDDDKDTLIVCDSFTSSKIIEFCQFHLSDRNQKLMDIPF